eukprot:jgi/Chlat1/1559/Chrsp123S01839
MVTTSHSVETGHEDMVHDVQLDYYGKRMATCSSDRTIRIFEVSGDQQTPLASLTGHDGPVWQVSWSHPKFGTLLASCSYDRRVIVWKETTDQGWIQVFQSPPTLHESSVNSVCWAPHQLGLMLACASSDGSVSILTNRPDGSWDTAKIKNAHSIGCTAVSWAPAVAPGALVSSGASPGSVKRLVSSGCDNLVKTWRQSDSGDWIEDQVLSGHTDWVRDVAWAPNLGLPMNTIASGSQDGTVRIWTQAKEGEQWNRLVMHDFKTVVWRVSWSITGNILAVAAAGEGGKGVTLWKETLDGQWSQISTVQ